MSPLIQRDFVFYADTLFAQLGDLVDQWMTFNEVITILLHTVIPACSILLQKVIPAGYLPVNSHYQPGPNEVNSSLICGSLVGSSRSPRFEGCLQLTDINWQTCCTISKPAAQFC